MNNRKIHNPDKVIVIPANHAPGVNYLVTYGNVDWKKDGAERTAIYILMEYQGRVSYQTPAHITTERGADGKSDLDRVLEAIEKLKKEYNL